MLDKALTLASLNARGLGTNSPKQKAIKLWLASLPSPPPKSSSSRTPPGKKRFKQRWKRNRVLEGSFLLESRDPHGNLT